MSILPPKMSDEWIELDAGPLWRVEMLQEELANQGVDAFVPDTNLKRVDPFAAAGNVFDYRLLVRAEHSSRARELLQELQLRPEEQDEPERVDEAMFRLERLGRRIQWCAMVTLFAPVGLWLWFRYVRTARDRTELPRDHRWTRLAAVMCAVEIVTGITFWVAVKLFEG
jgi:hypothetical protein